MTTIGNRRLVLLDEATVQEQEAVASEALALPEQARTYKVEDADSLCRANEFFLTCHAMEKKIDATFDPICKATNTAHKAATKAKADAKTPVSVAKSIVRKEIEDYNMAQEYIRRDLERIAQEEEVRRAETRQVERAATLEAQGHGELAEAVLQEPVAVPQVALPTVKQELAGSTFIDVWRYKVVDPVALLRAAADGLIAFSADNQGDEGAIGATSITIEVGKYVAALKDKSTLPGIKVWKTQSFRAKGR